jgi:hypothetical protein
MLNNYTLQSKLLKLHTKLKCVLVNNIYTYIDTISSFFSNCNYKYLSKQNNDILNNTSLRHHLLNYVLLCDFTDTPWQIKSDGILAKLVIKSGRSNSLVRSPALLWLRITSNPNFENIDLMNLLLESASKSSTVIVTPGPCLRSEPTANWYR